MMGRIEAKIVTRKVLGIGSTVKTNHPGEYFPIAVYSKIENLLEILREAK